MLTLYKHIAQTPADEKGHYLLRMIVCQHMHVLYVAVTRNRSKDCDVCKAVCIGSHDAFQIPLSFLYAKMLRYHLLFRFHFRLEVCLC